MSASSPVPDSKRRKKSVHPEGPIGASVSAAHLRSGLGDREEQLQLAAAERRSEIDEEQRDPELLTLLEGKSAESEANSRWEEVNEEDDTSVKQVHFSPEVPSPTKSKLSKHSKMGSIMAKNRSLTAKVKAYEAQIKHLEKNLLFHQNNPDPDIHQLKQFYDKLTREYYKLRDKCEKLKKESNDLPDRFEILQTKYEDLKIALYDQSRRRTILHFANKEGYFQDEYSDLELLAAQNDRIDTEISHLRKFHEITKQRM